MVAGSVTSQGSTREPGTSLASSRTLFSRRSPAYVKASRIPAPARLFAQPQAIERLLATPKMIPVLPARMGSKCGAPGRGGRVGGGADELVRISLERAASRSSAVAHGALQQDPTT